MSTVNSEDFSVNQWQANATAQIVSASISFLASLVMVASIGKSFLPMKRNSEHDDGRTVANRVVDNQNSTTSRLKKKTSPYRRIIFLISFSDILLSLAYITGPFMAQKTNPQALWGVSDSNAACVLNGFFYSIGANTSQLYYATLCYFYYCKISKKMTDEQFTRRYEKKMHITIAVICLTRACLSFAANTLNTYRTGTFCGNANTPAGCNQQPEIYGECDPKVKGYTSYFSYFSLLVSAYSIVVMLYSMIRLVYSVLKKDRMFGELPSNPCQEQSHKHTVRKKLLRETMSQAIMYTGSWLICQSVTIVVAILIFTGVSEEKFPSALQIFIFAIVPLTGAVNVFIYTRPAVRHVRRVDPSISRVAAFWMVLQAGGEAPNMEQSSTIQQHQQPRPSMSSREPFQCYYYHGNDLCSGLDSLGSLNSVSSVDLRVMFSEDLVERVSVSTWSGLDPSNTIIASKSKDHDLDGEPFGKDMITYRNYDDDMLEVSGRTSEDNVAGRNMSHTFDNQVQEDLDDNSSI
jgi:hypothetical protein